VGRVFPVLLLSCSVLGAAPAQARARRTRFDPSDLALQSVGGVEIDTQWGIAHSDGAAGNRLVLPDWEVDIGLTPRVELDIDGAFSFDQYDTSAASWSSDPLWIAVSLGLYDDRDADGKHTLAAGLQLGPRFPLIRQKGVGYAAVGLLASSYDGVGLTFNAGFDIDPLDRVTGHHPVSLVTGFDYDIDLDHVDRWSIVGDGALVYFLSDDPNTLTFTAGPSCKLTPRVEVQLAGLVGALPGDDRYGALAQLTLTLGPAPN
jgi:hypothetical protein